MVALPLRELFLPSAEAIGIVLQREAVFGRALHDDVAGPLAVVVPGKIVQENQIRMSCVPKVSRAHGFYDVRGVDLVVPGIRQLVDIDQLAVLLFIEVLAQQQIVAVLPG